MGNWASASELREITLLLHEFSSSIVCLLVPHRGKMCPGSWQQVPRLTGPYFGSPLLGVHVVMEWGTCLGTCSPLLEHPGVLCHVLSLSLRHAGYPWG